MNKTKSAVIGLLLACLGCLGWSVPQAQAGELWDPHLRGVNEGLPAGALPPEGVYFLMNNYFADYKGYGSSNDKSAISLQALVEVPIAYWSTGLKIFGADYGVGIAQPFDYTAPSIAGGTGPAGSGAGTNHWGLFNTIIIPGELSWALPNNFHVKTGLQVFLPSASSYPGTTNKNYLQFGSGNGYTTVMPKVGVSWLADGWNLSADINYAINSSNNTTGYKTGQQVAIDYTATKQMGNWVLGLGAHQLNQVTNDSGSPKAYPGGGPDGYACVQNLNGTPGCRASTFGLGPIVGYNLGGGAQIMFVYNQAVYAKNDVAGSIFNLRLLFPLGK